MLSFLSPADFHLEGEMQCSRTDEYCSASWACKTNGKQVFLSEHWHYRLVMGTVGYGLRRFIGTEELLHATYDVLRGQFWT